MTAARRPVSVRGRYRSTREEGDSTREQKLGHVAVMVREVVRALAPARGEVLVDTTYGQGGHTKVLKAAGAKVISLDADPASGADAVANFGDLQKVLRKLGIKKINKILFDLGWNRGQLASLRGFSFMHDEPLDMSYGPEPRSGFTAAEILNMWSEKALADALFGYGEERYARRIAGAVVARRKEALFKTTIELVELVRDNVPPAYRHGRIHPATRTFQALRMAVNDELGVLESGLTQAWKLLEPCGRVVVITFHSIEDRMVKRLFKKFSAGGGGELLYKKPLTPTEQEVRRNQAARSAKLRAIQKPCD